MGEMIGPAWFGGKQIERGVPRDDGPCCDYRDHEWGRCGCEKHPRSELHAHGWTPTFVVEDVFYITGRGPVITRSVEAARAAWARGDRWETGQKVVCGNLHATIVGIERFCVAPDHPAYNDGALMLRGVDIAELEIGQVWSLDD